MARRRRHSEIMILVNSIGLVRAEPKRMGAVRHNFSPFLMTGQSCRALRLFSNQRKWNAPFGTKEVGDER